MIPCMFRKAHTRQSARTAPMPPETSAVIRRNQDRFQRLNPSIPVAAQISSILRRAVCLRLRKSRTPRGAWVYVAIVVGIEAAAVWVMLSP